MRLKSRNAKKLAGSALLATTSAIAIVVACGGNAQAGSSNVPLPLTNNGTTDFIEYNSFFVGNGDITNNGTINTTTAGHTRAIAINTVNLGAPNIPPPANRPGALTNIVNTSTGSINATTTGVAVATANLWGTISNAGTLTANSGNGIFLNNVNSSFPLPGLAPGVLTSITNSGTITAHGSGAVFDPVFGAPPKGNGIAVVGSTTVAGSIGNSGTINADQAGILVMGPTNVLFPGTTVTGSVGNTGSINGTNGISITTGGVVQGGLSNGATGTITTSGPAILVQNGASVTGGITNGGTLTSNGAQTPFFSSGAIGVLGGTVNGNITNNKVINSASNGITVSFLNQGFGFGPASTVNGDVVNSATGTIAVTGLAGSGVNVDGINVNGSTVVGKLSNAGTLTSGQGNGISVTGFFSNVTKGIANSGTIAAGAGVHGQQGNGISVAGTLSTVSGSGGAPAILNSGMISAGGNGINVGFANTVVGDIKNTGGISATTPLTMGTASTTAGVGVNVASFGTVNGAITNDTTGTIVAVTGIANAGIVTGGINNSGFLLGTTAAVNTTAGTTATTINQSAGIMSGAVMLSNSNADKLNVSGGVQVGQITGGSNTKVNISSTGTVVLLNTFHDTVGSFTQSGGTFNVFVDAPAANGSTTGKSGTVALGSGPVVLSSNGVFEITELGNPAIYKNHQTYLDVLSTGGSVTGSLPTSISDSPYFTASVQRDLGGVTVQLDRIAFASFTGLTRNQSQTAVGLDAFFNGPLGPDAQALLGAIMSLNPSNLGMIADQLSGSQHPQSNHVALTMTQTTLRLIQDRLGSIGGGFAAGGAVANLSNGGARFQVASLDEIYDDGSAVAQAGGGSDTGPISVWVRAFGRFGNADSTIDAPGFSATSGGAILGGDYKVNENFLAGLAASFARTSVSFSQNAGSTDLDSFLISPYGKVSSGDWYASGVLGIGFDDFSTTRHIAFPGFAASPSSSHSGMAYGAYLETGYTFRPGNVLITPIIGLDAAHVSTDSFTESGAGAADLAVKSANSDSVGASIGVRLAGRVEGASGTFTPEAHAIYRHDFLADRQKVGEAFAQVPSGGVFTVVSSRFGKDAILAGVGVNYDLSPTSKIFATYDGEFSNGITAHTVSAGFRMKF